LKLDYALADLTRVTGAKRRSLQLWADAGVIIAESLTDRAGTGTHRRFSKDEAVIACIIRAYASHQIAIGELIEISKDIRSFVRTGLGRRIIDEVISGGENWGLTYESWRGGSQVSYFKGQPELKHLQKPDGFAALIFLKGYLANMRD
jgi:hypothetical protein